MTTYDSFVLFKQKGDVFSKDSKGYDYFSKEVRECTLVSELNGKVDKYFRVSLASPSDIDISSGSLMLHSEHNSRTNESTTSGFSYPDIVIEAFDKDNLTGKMNKRMDFLVNPLSIIYHELKNFGVIIIPKEFTNSNTDITIFRTLFTDGTIALTINNVNLKDNETLLKIYYDDYKSDLYDTLLEFYKLFESSSIISSRYDETKLPKM